MSDNVELPSGITVEKETYEEKTVTTTVSTRVKQTLDKEPLPDDLDTRITALHIKNLLDIIEKILNGRKLTVINYIRVVLALKDFCNGLSLPGEAKKQALLYAIDMYLKNQDMPEDERDTIIILIHQTLPDGINAIHERDKQCNTTHQNSCCIIC
jgi:hypothetical protein